MYLGMSQADTDGYGYARGTNEGNELKEIGTTHWINDMQATNCTGIIAVPGGERYYISRTFSLIGLVSVFWTSTEVNSQWALGRSLSYLHTSISRLNFPKTTGTSVRCIKDLKKSNN
jgi:uncharacterized protein (TIGR02145 family)